jgi:hypothetical protein
MKSGPIFLAFCLLSITLMSQTIPFNTSPDWTSTANGHRATGLGLADINNDGWKDLVVANGNDMARQRLVVYYNNQDGTFPLDPDWQSGDIDYHGHLSCGDIDQDGDIDVAVSVYIGAAGFSEPGKVKVYYNTGNELESMPSFVSEAYYNFSCALGDADGDGDLDLVTTGGEPYSELLDYGKIFLNNNGTFQTSPEWESDIQMGSLDVEFGDINRDGLMDVIFVCEGTDSYIYAGLPQGGISTSPAWHSSESTSFINSVEIGYRGDHEALVVMTENSQLGGQGKVRRYLFDGALPASSTADWYSGSFGYGSGIFLADVDLDSTLDLIYGGWWLPVKVALGHPDGFEMISSYTSSTGSVVETIQMTDLGRESVQDKVAIIIIEPEEDGIHTLVLSDQVVENILSVSINGVDLDISQYCTVPNKNWVSIGQELQAQDVVVVQYQYSPHPDMVVTNWDNNIGNYIFYNTNPPVGIPEQAGSPRKLSVFPNPARDVINLQISGPLPGTRIMISDPAGRIITDCSIIPGTADYRIDISSLGSGIYFIRTGSLTARFIKH